MWLTKFLHLSIVIALEGKFNNKYAFCWQQYVLCSVDLWTRLGSNASITYDVKTEPKKELYQLFTFQSKVDPITWKLHYNSCTVQTIHLLIPKICLTVRLGEWKTFHSIFPSNSWAQRRTNNWLPRCIRQKDQKYPIYPTKSYLQLNSKSIKEL